LFFLILHVFKRFFFNVLLQLWSLLTSCVVLQVPARTRCIHYHAAGALVSMLQCTSE